MRIDDMDIVRERDGGQRTGQVLRFVPGKDEDGNHKHSMAQ